MSSSKGVEVSVVICPACKQGIYSVARYDFHYCDCGGTFVDGGFDYVRYGTCDVGGRARVVFLKLPLSKEIMYADYAKQQFGSQRQCGYLSWDEVKTLYRSQLKKNIRMVAPKSGSAARSRSKAVSNKRQAL